MVSFSTNQRPPFPKKLDLTNQIMHPTSFTVIPTLDCEIESCYIFKILVCVKKPTKANKKSTFSNFSIKIRYNGALLCRTDSGTVNVETVVTRQVHQFYEESTLEIGEIEFQLNLKVFLCLKKPKPFLNIFQRKWLL